MIKSNKIFGIGLMAVTLLFSACDKEENPLASEDLGIPQLFAPPANADERVKTMYNDYGFWVRMDFTNWKEVTNAYLAQDQNNRYGATKIDDKDRESAIIYSQTLLSNVSGKFAKSYFPLELFFVKTYNGSWWKADYQRIGRSRFVVCWPNEMKGALPIKNVQEHYYQDSVITRLIWNNFGAMISARFEEPIKEFVLAGKAYDKGEAFDNLKKQYEKDKDQEKFNNAVRELCELGGFISGSGAGSFEVDFADWLSLLVMESYDHIKRDYLDNSIARKAKYDIIIHFFKTYDWDIQAAGNKFRQKFDAYKATLPVE